MDVLQAPIPESAMAVADDVMEFSAEGRTPAGDDIDIEFGDGEDNLAGEDQDMVEDDGDNLVDDEMADEDAAAAPQPLDTDIDLDGPSIEVLDAVEVNMGSLVPSAAASPMAHGGTPATEDTLDAFTEAAALAEQDAAAEGVEAPLDFPEVREPAALEDEQVSTRDFALAPEAEIPRLEEESREPEAVAETEAHAEVREDELQGPHASAGQVEDQDLEPESIAVLDDPVPDLGTEHAAYTEGAASAENTGEVLEADDAEREADARSEADSLLGQTALHAVMVDYQGSKMSLFPSSSEHEGSESFLLEDETLCYEPLSRLLAGCRSVLKDEVLDGEEVVLHLPCMALAISEDLAENMATTMSNLIDMFLHLSYNDGVEAPEALSVLLEVKPKAHFRLDFLRAAVADGKGLSQVGATHAPRPNREGGDDYGRREENNEGEGGGGEAEHVDNDFEEQFEIQSPAQEGSEDEADDILEFASPVKNAKEPRTANDEAFEESAEAMHAPGQDASSGEIDLAAEALAEVPEDSYPALEASEDDGLRRNRDFLELGYGATDAASLNLFTNDSSETAQGTTANAQDDTFPDDDAAAASFDPDEVAEVSEDTAHDDEAADEPTTPRFDDGAQDIQGHLDSESHTERGDDSANAPASPASLKRRRSYEEAADLLDDSLTPSPQAKRTRPS